MKILSIGATGSIGRLVIDEALRQGHDVRALVRSQTKVDSLPVNVETVIGDLLDPQSLETAVEAVDAVVFTHGVHTNRAEIEAIDYGGVRNVLSALEARSVRIALMTSIGVTNREGSFNQTLGIADAKRRSERLVRASGHPYTIVRPAWFDMNTPDQHQLQFLQGDTSRAASPADGVVARSQIAQVLVAALTSEAATRKTFELVAVRGAAQPDFEPLFAALMADPIEGIDGVHDAQNLPLSGEPAAILADLDAIRRS